LLNLVENDFASYIKEPKNYKEAIANKEAKNWQVAMVEEYDSQMHNKTWLLTKLSANQYPVSCK